MAEIASDVRTAPERRAAGVFWTRRRINFVQQVLGYIFLTAIAFVFMIPMFWTISAALKTKAQTYVFPPVWIPNPVNWDNFARVFREWPFLVFVRNSLIIVFWNILGQVLSVSLVAYGFARLRFPGRDTLFLIMLATLMIPYQVTLIPTFIMYKLLGWINTYLPLTVPAFTGGPFFIFLMRQYMMTIPLELDDAARIDGCNTFQILFKILMPLCIPPLAIVVVFSFVWTWNDFFGPLIYLQDHMKYTVALGLNFFRGHVRVEWNLLMAASLMAVAPCLVLYFFAQRLLIGGIASVGLKG